MLGATGAIERHHATAMRLARGLRVHGSVDRMRTFRNLIIHL